MVGSIIIVLLNLIGVKFKNLSFFNIFSKIFITLILLSFLYYAYDTLSRSGKSFSELISGFYEWAIYLAFYFLIISIIGSAIFTFFKQKKQ